VELFKRHFSDDCLLVNGLGATETGIVRQFFLGKNTELPGGILPIGYPVEDMELLIVDEKGTALPFHQRGEIAVRSKFLASGYWKNDALSSTAFIPDHSDPTMRMYRTGDMGRMSEDGCVAYLGRKDFQLKIRGNRVDPAEVESHLIKLPEVKDAVVATKISSRGDGQLAAYIIPHGRPYPTHSYLRRRLGESLPEYMIPTRFILMESFPLNANLKVDRKALPDPEHVNRISSVRYQAPANSTEVSLVKIWESIFKVSPIGINDNFFDLGGDSLYAAEIYTQVGKQFGKELDMRTLLLYPTVGQLAKFITEHRRQGNTVLVPLQPLGSRRPLFCVHGHGGHVHAYVPLSRIIGNDQPLYGLQSEGESLSTIEKMASAYIKEMRNVQPEGPYSIGGFCYGGIIALEMAHQLIQSGENVAHLIMFDVTPAEFTPLFSKNILSGYYHHVKSERKRRFISGLEGLPVWDKVVIVLGSAIGKGVRVPYDVLGAPWKNTSSSHQYNPVPFPGTVSLFLSRETTASYTNNPLSVWNALSRVGVEVVLCTGEEGVMFSEPHVQFLASELNRILSSK
jgi:acyl carrier protein